MSEIPQPVKATELFPELSADMDRRISHSETRLKFWVVGGVLANLIALAAIGLPMVYYAGQVVEQIETDRRVAAQEFVEGAERDAILAARGIWMQDRRAWELSVEPYLRELGWNPPRYASEFSPTREESLP